MFALPEVAVEAAVEGAAVRRGRGRGGIHKKGLQLLQLLKAWPELAAGWHT